jgi:hypothetical protein
LLRFFAPDDDQRVRVYNKDRSPRPKGPIGVNDVFVRKHFSSYDDEGETIDDLEDQWRVLEDLALPQIRSWKNGRETSTSRDAARLLASIHFARSHGLEIVRRRVSDSFRDGPTDWLEKDGPAGLGGLTGEALRPLIVDSLPILGDRSLFRIEGMGMVHNECRRRLDPLEVRAIVPSARAPDFVLADIPFVLTERSGMRVGVRDGLTFSEATTMAMPLARRLAVMFSSEAGPDTMATTDVVQRLNLLSWRGAFRQVAAHQDTDINRSLGFRLI